MLFALYSEYPLQILVGPLVAILGAAFHTSPQVILHEFISPVSVPDVTMFRLLENIVLSSSVLHVTHTMIDCCWPLTSCFFDAGDMHCRTPWRSLVLFQCTFFRQL